MSDMKRTCKECIVEKDIDDFEKSGSATNRDARRLVCKVCRTAKRSKSIAIARVEKTALVAEDVPKPKACITCKKGPDEVAFKWRSDTINGGWRGECNTCYNKKGYSEKSRAKAREEDEAGFLKKNAESHLAWVKKNPEKIKEQYDKRRNEAGSKIKQIRAYANQKKIDFDNEDISKMEAKLMLSCTYCDYTAPANEVLNGLDRIDSAFEYNDKNTVTCCATCNAIKGIYDTGVFIENIRKIYAYNNISKLTLVKERCRLPAFGGRKDLRESPEKTKTDYLTRKQKVELWSSPCYLCGSIAYGIDRQDANGDYTVANSKPCCAMCNYMKKDFDLDCFLQHLKYIYDVTKNVVTFFDESKWMDAIDGNNRVPVEATDCKGILIVFPSANTAANMIGTKAYLVNNAIKKEELFRNRRWKVSTAHAYISQMISSEVAQDILMDMNLKK
jgi:hypothetical protein